MVEDIVRAYGFLPLGSRLRRIGERLQADTQRVMDEMDVPLQAGQYPFLGALDRLGPLTVGELAEAVGITQQGELADALEVVVDPVDGLEVRVVQFPGAVEHAHLAGQEVQERHFRAAQGESRRPGYDAEYPSSDAERQRL